MATVLPSQAPLTRFIVRHPQQLRTVRSIGPDNSTPGLNPSRRPGFSGVELVRPRPAAAEAARTTRSYRGLNRRRLEHGAHTLAGNQCRPALRETRLAWRRPGFLLRCTTAALTLPSCFWNRFSLRGGASRRGGQNAGRSQRVPPARTQLCAAGPNFSISSCKRTLRPSSADVDQAG
jgi:hypothetical protein